MEMSSTTLFAAASWADNDNTQNNIQKIMIKMHRWDHD